MSDEDCSKKKGGSHIAIMLNVALDVLLEDSMKIGKDFKLAKILQLLVLGGCGDLLAKNENIINTPY